MSLFHAIDTAATGVGLGRFWLDTTSDNIANLNTVRAGGEEPFRARMVVAQSRGGLEGVRVTELRLKGGDPELHHDPTNPLADDRGYVTRPNVELSEEMTSVLMASRLYQANLAVIRAAQDSYSAALQLGRR